MLSPELQATLQRAVDDVRERRHEYLTLEHLLLSILDDPSGADIVVKCGGERVSLDEVTAVIRSTPGVDDVCVIAVPDERLGNRLVAFVSGADGIAGPVREWVRAWLPAAKRPSRIVGLPALPRSANGKFDVAQLRELAGEQAEAC